MDDLISRQAGRMTREEAVSIIEDRVHVTEYVESSYVDCVDIEALKMAIKALRQPEQQWIPVKTRPMDEEERSYYEKTVCCVFEDEDAVIFNCPMPEDGQKIWVTTKSGYVFQDVCEIYYNMFGLEGNGDWVDIVAWMPMFKPEPYKEEEGG